MTHNEPVTFLITQGWEYDPNASNGKCFKETIDNENLSYTMIESLEIEKMNNPDAYMEFELVNSLNSRYMTMVSQYMDS